MPMLMNGQVPWTGPASVHADTAVGPLAVTRKQAAQMVSLSVTEIDDERRAGRLVARKHGRKVLIPVDELKRWADSLPSDQMRFAADSPRQGGIG